MCKENLNGDLGCNCLSFSSYSYQGAYCQSRVSIVATTSTSPSVVDNSALIVSIVLPILVFFTLMTIIIVVVYFKCVGQKGSLRLNTSSAIVVQEENNRKGRGERRFTPIDRMSLPIDYHEQSTTPYEQGRDEDDYVINAFQLDNDDDLNNVNITEAINPNVNIPRPKLFSKF